MTMKKLFVALAALALIATACGDAADDTTTTTAAPTTDAPPATDAPPDTEAPPATTMAPTTTVAETTTTTSGVPDDWPETIVVGFIPSERQETLEDTIQPFMDALSERLGIEVEGIVTSDYNGLVVALGAGQVDFAAFGPFGYVQAKEQFPDVEVLIQSIRFGSATYHGQWFAQPELAGELCEEDPVPGALENLNGEVVLVDPTEAVALQVGIGFDDEGNKVQEVLDDGTEVDIGLACLGDLTKLTDENRIAFGSPTSTSSSVFPRLQLINEGVDLDSLEFEFVGSHTDAVAAVYNDDFAVGASFDDARRSLREESPDVGSNAVVFAITPEIPNDVVAVRGELPDSLKEAFFAAVQDYLETEEGEAVLDEVYGWTDVQPASESAFDIVRDAAQKLGITED